MNPASASLGRQRGAVLVVGMIMLVLITLMVGAAFTLSSANMKAVGNMQFRNAAQAAADAAVRQVAASDFVNSPPASDQEVLVDVYQDGHPFSVIVAVPQCVRAIQNGSVTAQGTGTRAQISGLVDNGNIISQVTYLSTFDIAATVTDAATGAQLKTHIGMREVLSQTQCNLLCAPAAGVACS